VRIGMWEEPHTLDPIISTMSFEDDVFQLEYDGLIRYDGHAQAVPDLARAVPSLANGGISHDGKTLTWHLLPNVTWHDGAPLTAADVVYTWHQIMNPANNTIERVGYDRIASIETPDPLTVRVHLRAAYAPAVYLFANGSVGAIVPQHLYAKYASLNATPFDTRPVGSGPYIFKSWSHGGQMEFDANPHYFRGAPKIAHVIVKFIPDQNTLMNALRAHDVDLYYLVSAMQAGVVRTIPDTTFLNVASLNWEHLTFNTQRAALADVRVRLALCYGFDQMLVERSIYHGLGGYAPTDISPGAPEADPAIHYYPYDPKKAAALLDAAGWKLGADGVRRKGGQSLSFAISTVAGVKLRENLEVVLQRAWKAIGADVTVKNYPASLFFAPRSENGPLYGGHTDVAIYTSSHSWPDPDDENSLAPDRLPPAGENTSFFQNAELGRLIAAGLATYDVKVRIPIYRRIAQIEIANVPEYTLNWEPQIMAASDDLHGLVPNPVGSNLWNIAAWTIGR
jgi:peptide/nickel transport system substrate-binding protein